MYRAREQTLTSAISPWALIGKGHPIGDFITGRLGALEFGRGTSRGRDSPKRCVTSAASCSALPPTYVDLARSAVCGEPTADRPRAGGVRKHAHHYFETVIGPAFRRVRSQNQRGNWSNPLRDERPRDMFAITTIRATDVAQASP